MFALVLIGIAGLGGAVALHGIIQGHAEALDEPDSRNFALAFWIFVVLMSWHLGSNPEEPHSVYFWIYLVIAIPSIILNLINAFTR